MGAKKKRFAAVELAAKSMVCGPQWQIRMRKSPRSAGIELFSGHPVLRFALDGVTTFHIWPCGRGGLRRRTREGQGGELAMSGGLVAALKWAWDRFRC